MQHDPCMRAAARAIYETVYPTEDWAPVGFDEAEQRRTIHYRQAVDAALRVRWQLASEDARQLACRRCPHNAILSGYALWWLCERRRWPTALTSLMRRFYCEPCWRTRFCKVTNPRFESTRREVTQNRLPEPTEAQWKRMVKRHRT